jgi:apolipoprotein N-acyltransferase
LNLHTEGTNVGYFRYFCAMQLGAMTLRRSLCVLLSAALLSTGWLGLSGLPLLVALIPLLWISDSYGTTCRDWWRMCGWASLTFILWNAATIWGLWYATPVGPIAATIVSTVLNLLAFMLYHTVSKRARRALAYTLLVSGWIATEYWYTVGEISFPWLLLGNGFAGDPWAIQWYEYTGIFGGSLWALLANLTIYEALRTPTRRLGWIRAAVVVGAPLLLSGVLWTRYQTSQRTMQVSVVQPNIDCYDKFHAAPEYQVDNLLSLLQSLPDSTQMIAFPETALIEGFNESLLTESATIHRFTHALTVYHPQATLVTGADTYRIYPTGMQSSTARFRNGFWFDRFNTALQLDSCTLSNIRHKSRLVIGVEKMPVQWLFNWLEFLVIDLGGTTGQLGVDHHPTNFVADNTPFVPAICYESVYGAFLGEFVQRGAQFLLIITNDGWWGDTAIHRQHFDFARLRAIEHRRAVARCANTGISGFINARGEVVGEPLGWDCRGSLTQRVELRTEQTFYTRYGDYLGRIAEYLMLLCILYYIAYRAKRRNYLVD